MMEIITRTFSAFDCTDIDTRYVMAAILHLKDGTKLPILPEEVEKYKDHPSVNGIQVLSSRYNLLSDMCLLAGYTMDQYYQDQVMEEERQWMLENGYGDE